jgi:hypothetical protein
MWSTLKLSFVILFFCFYSAQAQFKKGNKMIGVNVATAFFNSGSSDVSYPPPTQGYSSYNTSFSVNIMPSLGWFISDNIVAGGTFTINPTHQKIRYEAGGSTYRQDKANSFNIGGGGFIRNYFKTSSSFIPFGQLDLNLGTSSQKTEGFFYSGSDKSTYSGKSSGGFFMSAGLLLGLTKLLNANTGLDIYTGYNYSYNKNTNKTITNIDSGNNGSIDLTEVREPTTKFTNHGFVFGVGFQIFLTGIK